MNSVYIVRSGLYDGNIGLTTWMNVRAFTSYEVASAWIESEKLRELSMRILIFMKLRR